MSRLNKVFLIGRLTKDPELRFIANGTPVANFTLAVNRSFKPQNSEQQQTDFIDIVVWRKQAENCKQYLFKGQEALVEGRLQIRSYEAADGTKRKVAEVVADNVQFLSKPMQKNNNNSGLPPIEPIDSFGSESDDNDEVPF
jgi:single-strand DNA-binding protein